jgi:ABC-type Fe3+-hydroxamate transport system substrate-binding protein
MPVFTDQLNRQVMVPEAPQRIVSLVPSQTELLYDLGLDEAVAGITKFCVHPEQWFRNKTRVGGTKNVNFAAIDALSPDLIIANKEENLKEEVEQLAGHYPVWISDISTFSDAINMIRAVGEITGRADNAISLSKKIEAGFGAVNKTTTAHSVAYLIWKDPWMTVGGDTFIHAMLGHCGFSNVYGHLTRYAVVTMEQIKEAAPQLLLLSSEPYPFRQKHIDELAIQLPFSRILLVDGEMFSWYGSRLLHAPAYFNKLIEEVNLDDH